MQDGDCSEDVKEASYAHCEGKPFCTVLAPQSTWGEECGSWFGDWHDYFVVDFTCRTKGDYIKNVDPGTETGMTTFS